jgi:hypothetical protein
VARALRGDGGTGSVKWSMRPMVESESTEELTWISRRLKGTESWPDASCRRGGPHGEGERRLGGALVVWRWRARSCRQCSIVEVPLRLLTRRMDS